MEVAAPDLSDPPIDRRRVGTRALIGRTAELAELGAALADAIAGHGACCLITGEAGIGKSLLLESVCRDAELAGATVARGATWEAGGAPAYWPVLDALGQLDVRAASVLESPGTREYEDAGLEPDGTPQEPDSVRFTRFRALGDRLAALSVRSPVLIALEDIHAADAPSLLLLRFLARRAATFPLLLVATMSTDPPRPAEAPHGLLEALAADSRRVSLRGLSETETGELARHRLGRPLSLAATRRLYGVTEGNPMFVEELVRRHAEPPSAAGDPDRETAADGLGSGEPALPHSMIEALRHRVRRLDPRDAKALALAAVCGREFDPGVLSRVAGLSPAAIDGVLRRATEARLLEAGSGRSHRFSHGLLRIVALEGLDAAVRREAHLSLARALEGEADPPPRIAEVAHHYREAVPAAPAATAVRWSLTAARAALGVLAYEEAARHAEQALALAADRHDELQLLLLLGEAQMAAGDPAAARVALVRAAGLAAELREPELQARAALSLGGGPRGWARRAADPELTGLLETAAASVSEAGLKARVSARLATELRHGPAAARAERLAEEAVRAARAADDDHALAGALEASLLTSLSSSTPAARAELVAELIEAAARTGDPDTAQAAWLWRLNHALETADRDQADHARATLVEIAERTHAPHQLWSASVTEAMLALLDGRLTAAEGHMTTALTAAEGVVPAATGMYATQLMALRREQGRLAELESFAREAAASGAAPDSWRCAWIGILCEQGREDEARAELGRLAAGASRPAGAGGEGAPVGDDGAATVLMLAEIAARLDDRVLAERLLPRLAVHAGQVAVVSFSVLCRGAVDRYLGLLAGVLGDYPEAERHFQAAQRIHARLRSPLWSARTEIDLAASRAAAGEPATAARSLEATLALAEARGWPGLAARARSRLDVISAVPKPGLARAPAVDRLLFRRDGEIWLLGDPQAPVHLPDARGLGYIAELLRHPGHDLYAAELAGAPAAGEQNLLDEQAKAAYHARVEQLRDDLDQAERFGDPERAARSQAELDALTTALSRAVGLRGHDRRLAGPAERARSSVTKAIRTSIRRIERHDSALGAHLDGAIRTGTFCRYVPDQRHPIRWELTM